jgi:hypothetical protein
MEGVSEMDDGVVIIDFSQPEAHFIADILDTAYSVADLSGSTKSSLELFDRFIEALNEGHTIRICQDNRS